MSGLPRSLAILSSVLGVICLLILFMLTTLDEIMIVTEALQTGGTNVSRD